jgi:hypothetical protein
MHGFIFLNLKSWINIVINGREASSLENDRHYEEAMVLQVMYGKPMINSFNMYKAAGLR